MLVSIAAAASVLALIVLPFAVAPAGAESASPDPRTFRTPHCYAPAVASEVETWACTKLTIQPWKVSSGAPLTLTYSFKAKTTLRYVRICFQGVSAAGCAYAHEYPTITRGTVVKHVLHLVAPNSSITANYPVANATSFYSTSPAVAVAVRAFAKTDPSSPFANLDRFLTAWWWDANGHVCVVASDSNASCSWRGD